MEPLVIWALLGALIVSYFAGRKLLQAFSGLGAPAPVTVASNASLADIRRKQQEEYQAKALLAKEKQDKEIAEAPPKPVSTKVTTKPPDNTKGGFNHMMSKSSHSKVRRVVCKTSR